MINIMYNEVFSRDGLAMNGQKSMKPAYNHMGHMIYDVIEHY